MREYTPPPQCGGSQGLILRFYLFQASFDPGGGSVRAKGLRRNGRWGLRQPCCAVAPGIPWGSASGIPKSRLLRKDVLRALVGKAKSTGRGDTGCPSSTQR